MVLTGLVSLGAAAVVFALGATGVLGGSGYSGPGTVTGFGHIGDSPTPPSPTPASISASTAPLERMIIPAIGVDAPLTIRGIDAQGVMESPDGPWNVAWYNFTARPGTGSNAVFSGHVDYRGVGPAVFWRLKDLNPGDIIAVRLADGTVYRYSVTAKNVFDADTAPVEQIVGPTAMETVTLITCTGIWDPVAKQYDKRLVVQAQRIT